VKALDNREWPLVDKVIDYPFALIFFILAGFSGINLISNSDLYSQMVIMTSIPINLIAGIAFIIRKPAIEQTNQDEYIVPALSFILPFFVLNNIIFIKPDYSFSSGFLIAIPGVIIASIAIIFIRNSFAVFPAIRPLVFNGPYRYIRHPAYLGEMMYVFGSMLLSFNLFSILCIVATFAFTIGRIRLEEKKLGKLPQYEEYMGRVRFRLVPGIF
jgi:protein-S-isoprenylcysteine O-methyltransferase Ste14